MDFSAGFSVESSFSVCRFEKGSGWYSCKSPLHAHSVNKRAHKMWQQHTSMRERERENSQPLPLSWRTPPQQPLSKSQMLMLVHINTSGQISLDQTLGTPQQELYGNGECFNQSAEFYEAWFWDTPNIQTCLLQTKFKKKTVVSWNQLPPKTNMISQWSSKSSHLNLGLEFLKKFNRMLITACNETPQRAHLVQCSSHWVQFTGPRAVFSKQNKTKI